jgi:hypothetical protein
MRALVAAVLLVFAVVVGFRAWLGSARGRAWLGSLISRSLHGVVSEVSVGRVSGVGLRGVDLHDLTFVANDGRWLGHADRLDCRYRLWKLVPRPHAIDRLRLHHPRLLVDELVDAIRQRAPTPTPKKKGPARPGFVIEVHTAEAVLADRTVFLDGALLVRDSALHATGRGRSAGLEEATLDVAAGWAQPGAPLIALHVTTRATLARPDARLLGFDPPRALHVHGFLAGLVPRLEIGANLEGMPVAGALDTRRATLHLGANAGRARPHSLFRVIPRGARAGGRVTVDLSLRAPMHLALRTRDGALTTSAFRVADVQSDLEVRPSAHRIDGRTLTGQLTIRGRTVPISLVGSLHWGGSRVFVDAPKLVIDGRAFDDSHATVWPIRPAGWQLDARVGASRLRGAFHRPEEGVFRADVEALELEPALVQRFVPWLKLAEPAHVAGSLSLSPEELRSIVLVRSGAGAISLRFGFDRPTGRIYVKASGAGLSPTQVSVPRSNIELRLDAAFNGNYRDGHLDGHLTVYDLRGHDERIQLDHGRLVMRIYDRRFEVIRARVDLPGAIILARGGGVLERWKLTWGLSVTSARHLKQVPALLRPIIGVTSLLPGRAAIGSLEKQPGKPLKSTHHILPPGVAQVHLLYRLFRDALRDRREAQHLRP